MNIWTVVLLAIVLVCSGCSKEKIGESSSTFTVNKIEEDKFKDRFGYERHTGYMVQFTDGRNEFTIRIPVCDTYDEAKIINYKLEAKIILFDTGETKIVKANMTDDSLKNALLKAACL